MNHDHLMRQGPGQVRFHLGPVGSIDFVRPITLTHNILSHFMLLLGH